MAKSNPQEFPTTGGSYTRKSTGALDLVEATEPPPAVQEKPDDPVSAPIDQGKKE